MAAPTEYIAVVLKSPRVLDKIARRHDGIAEWEINEAAVLCPVADSWWDHDADRGWRLMVVGNTAAGRELFLVLYPVDVQEGTWRLGTAIRGEGQ